MRIFTNRILLVLFFGLALAACSSSGDIAGTNGTPGPVTSGALKLIAAAFQTTVQAGTVNVSVLRTGGTTGAVGVTYTTSDGTASAGTDYTAASGTLSWADGDGAAKSIAIHLSSATASTADKTFDVQLAQPTGGATLTTPDTAVVTIAHATSTPGPVTSGALKLIAATFQTTVQAGTVNVSVLRTGGTTGAVGVTYSTSDGTGAAGTDYTAVSGTLSWADGDGAAKSIAIHLSSAGASTADKTFDVQLAQPTGGATLTTPTTAVVTIAHATSAAGLSISVQGNHFVDGGGQTVQLRGVNIGGLESTAIQRWTTDPWGDAGFGGEPNWQSLHAWQVNVVRLPLNEASWLGLTTYDQNGTARQADPGSNYQATVIKSVADATAAGLYVILDLHWSGPKVPVPGQAGAVPQTPFEGGGGQNPMADKDHSLQFWTSIAQHFGQNHAVMFELFNEPYFWWITAAEQEWAVWRNGGVIAQYVTGGNPYQVVYNWQSAGMQQMLDAVRATGSDNVVIAGGVGWSSDMSGWMANKPSDPLQQLAAAWHAYPNPNAKNEPSAGLAQYSYVQNILAAQVPVIISETGDHNSAGTVGSPLVSAVLPWADLNGVSYLGWSWNLWANSDNVLIKDALGTPTDGYGVYFRQHLLCRGAGTMICL